MSSVDKGKLVIYEAVLSSPGMLERCKIGMSISRQNALVLCRLIDAGLNADKEYPDEMIRLLSKESKEELLTVVPEFLKKSGLTDFYEKLKQL